VIKSFADAETRHFWDNGTSRKGPPPQLLNVAKRKLQMLDAAVRLGDLKSPPGNKLHRLERQRARPHAIRIND
jgi:proteic killer suppression protein